MDKSREKLEDLLMILIDFLTMIFSYYLSGFIWLYIYKNYHGSVALEILNAKLPQIVIIFFVGIMIYFKSSVFMRRGSFDELKSVIGNNLLMGALIAVVELIAKSDTRFNRGVYVLCILLNILITYIIHIVIKKILYLYYGSSISAVHMMILTSKDRCHKVYREISKKENFSRIEMTVLDEDMVGQEFDGIRVAANKNTMLDYIKSNIVDEVFVDTGFSTDEKFKELIMTLEEMGITVHMRLDFMDEYADYDASYSRFGDVSVITFANRFYDYKALAVKRIIDITGSLVGLVIMGIAFIFVAPAIKLESPGPVFFKQKRVGKNGRFFYVYKFRSMYSDAEERKAALMSQNEMQGLMFKMKDDPRITKVGKFIRKTSIDELPQFINVFMGDMSLVGTRPPTVNEFKQYEGHHKRRLSMKPGITGMWQAYGRKTVTDFEDIVKMDLQYIDNWSLTLDIKILLRTVVAVFQGG